MTDGSLQTGYGRPNRVKRCRLPNEIETADPLSRQSVTTTITQDLGLGVMCSEDSDTTYPGVELPKGRVWHWSGRDGFWGIHLVSDWLTTIHSKRFWNANKIMWVVHVEFLSCVTIISSFVLYRMLELLKLASKYWLLKMSKYSWSEVYIHLSQIHLNSVFHNSWHLIQVQIPCLRSVRINTLF